MTENQTKLSKDQGLVPVSESSPGSQTQASSPFSGFRQAMQEGELKVWVQRAMFRLSQWVRQPNGMIAHYKNSLYGSWEKWLGLAAGITGLLMLLSPSAFWQWQLPVLLVIIVIAPLFFDLSRSFKEFFSAYPGQHLIGEIITLDQPIINGHGTIFIQREDWTVSGPDCTAGTRVKIIGIDDRKLYVASVD
ncbi:NfeD family protein [Thiofilum flexile]|uniref:NfeD family protein n=1 Tax=Thiofilum flexile TaxID=125627 RepID=UPI000373BF53|nr:NfeD family protein [Thiofilum flexile]